MKTTSREAADRREAIRSLILRAGFDRVGFAAARRAPSADRFREWLRQGFAGGMSYLERSPERREDPRRVLDGARTIIAVALHHDPPRVHPVERGVAEIAAYARSRDYHRVLGAMLRRTCADLNQHSPAAWRWYVDTGPLLERDWAQASGIGWIGKNACAIDPRKGSFFFLGVIVTTLEIEPDEPALDHCGTCRRCIDACPTSAILAPRQVDARRCISYLTIESREAFPEELTRPTGNLVFGCDICQAVCPFNADAPPTSVPDLRARPENDTPRLVDLCRLDAKTFLERFRGTPVVRAKFQGFVRNVIVALANEGGAGAVAALERLALRGDVAASPVLAIELEGALQRVSASGPMPSPSS